MSTLAIIAIVVIAMAVVGYPVMQLMPNKRQQQQMQSRQLARKLGLIVEMRTPPLSIEQEKTHAHTNQIVAYALRRKDDAVSAPFCALRSHFDSGQWLWLNNHYPNIQLREKLEPIMADLPQYIIGIEITPYQVSVFWHEGILGGDVESIQQYLLALS